MRSIARYLLPYLGTLCLTAALPAQAQTDYYNADAQPPAATADDSDTPESGPLPSHTFVVTSIEKCYAQLGRAAALDIEQHFEKPYEECQRRLALKIKQQHELKAGQLKNTGAANANDSATAKNPPATVSVPQPAATDEGSYYRVQKDPVPPADK